MPTYTDGVGRTVEVPAAPQRIVSLCPSQTETLFALGAGSRVVGRTQWCIYPALAIADVEAIGGTKKVNQRKLQALAPDLILCEKEENTPALVAACAAIAPTYVTDVVDLPSALAMIERVGALVGAAEQGAALRHEIAAAWQAIPHLKPPLSCAYLIWKDPWMAVGRGTYIDGVLGHLGFENACATLEGRYPRFALEQLRALAPEVVLLSSEPYAFDEAHVAEVSAKLPGSQVLCVDGEWFSWYGARMLPSAARLADWLRAFAPAGTVAR